MSERQQKEAFLVGILEPIVTDYLRQRIVTYSSKMLSRQRNPKKVIF